MIANNRGGKRIGAGRKAGLKGKRTPLTVKLPPLVQEFLSTLPSRGEFITRKVESSQEFRRWRQEVSEKDTENI